VGRCASTRGASMAPGARRRTWEDAARSRSGGGGEVPLMSGTRLVKCRATSLTNEPATCNRSTLGIRGRHSRWQCADIFFTLLANCLTTLAS
jgi:hypothetical protein